MLCIELRSSLMNRSDVEIVAVASLMISVFPCVDMIGPICFLIFSSKIHSYMNKQGHMLVWKGTILMTHVWVSLFCFL